MINLRFEKDEDGSGDGTFIISEDGHDFFFCPITHTEQKENIERLSGNYKKQKG